MGRRLTAIVEVSKDCPVYHESDLMTIELPEVIKEESQGICLVALADLLPSLLGLAMGRLPLQEQIPCRGCRAGRARAYFRIEPRDSIIDDDLRAALLPILRGIPLFSVLTERQLERLLPLVSVVDGSDGQVLLEYGASAQPLYIVVEGSVEILRPDSKGALKRIGTLGAGECIGEMSLLTGDPCSATTRCMGPTRLLRITESDFDALLDRMPLLNTYFSRLLALRLRKTSSQLIEDLNREHVISGDLSALSCAEVVQAIAATNHSGRLRLDGDGSLELVFRAGRIVHLATATEPPEEGFYQALSWQQGPFRFSRGEVGEVEQNVFLDTTGLLLEGMRRLDESSGA